MAPPRTLAALLDQVHRRVVRLGPREHLAIERLARQSEGWTHGELRAAVASVLARDAEGWEQICGLYDELVTGNGEAEAPARQPVVLEPARPPGFWARWRARWRGALGRITEGLARAPRWRWVAALAASLVVVVGLVFYFLVWRWDPPTEQVDSSPTSSPSAESSQPPTDEPTTAETDGTEEFLLVPVELPASVSPPTPSLPWTLAVVAVATVLIALGVRWMGIGRAVQAERRRRLAERRRRSEEERQRLEERQAAAGQAFELRYRVQLYLPVSRQAVLDSAELLGRIFRQERGIELDAEATLDRTIAAGGRFVPVVEPRFSRQEVLVLVHIEEGDHPWLGAFRRLLEAWAAQGIGLRIYDFQSSPDHLVERETKAPITVAELARASEGLALIVFSRRLDPHAWRGEPDWLSRLAAWPRRAWLDPDPRRPDELSRSQRHALQRFDQLGLPRFHLSDEGVVLLARWLSADGPRPAVLEPPLPALPEKGVDGPLAEGLRLWALAAALVPDPTWDQLEAIRRHFPELESALPEPRYLQRLFEWVERETDQSPELDGGRGLAIPEGAQHTWLLEQRRRERSGACAPDFETRTRQLLDEQLGSKPPADPLERQWWRFKRAMHRAVLEPGKVGEHLGWVFDSAIAHEAGRYIEAELDRQEPGIEVGYPTAELERLRARVGRAASGVPLWALVGAPWSLWRRAALGAAGLGAVLLAIVPGTGERIGSFFERQVDRPTAQAVADYSLLEMVTIEGGNFDMGSNEGDPDERPVHRVRVETFQISKTEVTVAQYRACVEAGACDPPESPFDTCNYEKKDRADHPMNCVSWIEAQQFATWLDLRLPSEAEWEFAARGRGLDREYPWGDERATCERAVVSGCSEEGTLPVCSKPAGSSEQGLCDMAGNVWEWVDDARASDRVIRGGSWGGSPADARVASRWGSPPSNRSGDVGFRVARSLPSSF